MASAAVVNDIKPSSLGARRQRPPLQIPCKKAPAVQSAPVRKIVRITGQQQLEDLFELRDEIMQEFAGQSTKLLNALCRQTGEEVVVKIRVKRSTADREKASMFDSLLTRILNLDDHSHVLGVRGVLEDDERYYIVMEKCSGGELFDFLHEETEVPERECKRIMREILAAVDHIHSQGLIHRDIKPENIMFHTERDGGSATPSPKENGTCRSIRLIDFDSALEMQGSASPRQKHIVGTMGYIAPEALKGDCSPASDLWSVGIIMYMLMTGDTPYDEELLDEAPKDTRCDSEAMDRLYTKLQRAKIDFECEPWPSFPEARDLCQELLAFEPSDRSPSAMHALSHPWLN